MHNYRLVSIL